MVKLKLASLSGLEKFRMAVVEDGMPAMKRVLRSKKAKLLTEELRKEIFELGPPTPPFKPTGRTKHQQWLMHHASEISRSLDTMRDVEFYVGKFPYRNTQIAKHRHLQFHVEAFFHELYILQQRLLQFLVFVERRVAQALDIDGARTPGLAHAIFQGQMTTGCPTLRDFRRVGTMQPAESILTFVSSGRPRRGQRTRN